ncbi:helix-turn-helix domain-containing protein [Polaromonas sp.]|uniref:helix-turn-helix domain-containing protein n=1 Tax=Polaromonas sp. TaxID=1869339 RepID=UPI0035686399
MILNATLHQIMWPEIIQLLKSRGYSQKRLAKATGVDQSTICRLGDGRAPEPRYSAGAALIELAGGAEALASAHGIDVAAFFGRTQAGVFCDPLTPDTYETKQPPALTGQAQAAIQTIAKMGAINV